MKKRYVNMVLRHLLLAVLAFVWLIPIAWLLVTSFSSYTGINTSTFFPQEWSLQNYKNLLFSADSVAQFPNWFKNTFIVACCSCVISSAFVLMVAYATSCMRFKMRKPLMNMAVIMNLFPGFLSMIAVYFILRTLNLTNNHWGLVLVYSASSCKGVPGYSAGFLKGSSLPGRCQRGKDFLVGGAAHEPAHYRLYGNQFISGTLDGFYLCKDDTERRGFLPVDGGNRLIQHA